MSSSRRPVTPASDAGATGRVRNTWQAAAIEAQLREADGFLTAQDLFARLRAGGERIGLTTVYRFLNLLAEQGRADVVRSAEGESQFRLCGPAGRTENGRTGGHHHHLVCRECGRSVEVKAPSVEAWATKVAADAGYTDIAHTVEIFGLCPNHGRRSRG